MDGFRTQLDSAIEEFDAVDIDVLVVGAGPVGLMVANELGRRGLSTRIIDRAAHRSPQSQALVVHARTLEILDLAGLSDIFVRSGYPAPGLNVGLGGSGSDITVDLRAIDSRYPFMLVLPQRETERILSDALTSHGVDVEWGTSLEGIFQSEEEVVATVRRGTGGYERIFTRYLVGCDGAHSTVRKLTNIRFSGSQHTESVLIGDVKVDADFTRTRITNFTGPGGFVSILPFLGDYVRVFAVDFNQQHHGRSEEVTLAELQRAVDSIAPRPIPLRDPAWLTRYIAPSRHVSTTRIGRIFLAGDAAHAHSPAGGQGMNTGLQDAANLGWKLAAVLGGHADPSLLDTYDLERRPVHDKVIAQTDRMFRTFVIRGRLARLLRRIIARTLVPRRPIQRLLAESLSGIAVNYRRTAARRTAADAPASALEAGDRIPDVQLWRAGRALVRLYEVLRGPGPALIVYMTGDRLADDRAAAAELIGTVAHLRQGWVTPYVVVDEGVLEEDAVGAGVLVDVSGSFAAAFGAVHGSVFLVRPDGYLATHQVGFDPDRVLGSFEPWLSSAAPRVAK
jgi:2-polyprenyl-6-methoxyphenol hydroxylase-like FAD-dependent oxidoreductase